jgi:hypothetical protein
VTAVVLLVILLSGHHNVTWSPKFLTCGRFPWKAPTVYFTEAGALLCHFFSIPGCQPCASSDAPAD